MKNKRKYQIGVMGSASDLKYSKEIEKIAFEVGKEISLSGNITVYGAEKDYDSLSTCAARGAKSENGTTVGVTYGKNMDIWDKDNNTDVVISTGIERGGGREFVLVNSCDAIIAVSGGSGTLTDIAIAYQSNIPVVVINNTGGWSDKLCDSYLDDRKRVKIIGVNNSKDAVRMVLRELDYSSSSNVDVCAQCLR
jgi:uncharacterized protein (TIGR00725 family)